MKPLETATSLDDIAESLERVHEHLERIEARIAGVQVEWDKRLDTLKDVATVQPKESDGR